MIVINMRSMFVPAEDHVAVSAREEHVWVGGWSGVAATPAPLAYAPTQSGFYFFCPCSHEGLTLT